MNKNFKILFCFLVSTFLQKFLYSQTVIDYTTFSTTQCNSFSPAVLIAGSLHTSTCGTVQYNSVNHDIVLNADANNNVYRGTEYKLSYTFKLAYSYTIKINAMWSTPVFPVPNSKLRVDFTSASNGGGSSCNGVESFNTTSSLSGTNNQQLNPGSLLTIHLPSHHWLQRKLFYIKGVSYLILTALLHPQLK